MAATGDLCMSVRCTRGSEYVHMAHGYAACAGLSREYAPFDAVTEDCKHSVDGSNVGRLR